MKSHEAMDIFRSSLNSPPAPPSYGHLGGCFIVKLVVLSSNLSLYPVASQLFWRGGLPLFSWCFLPGYVYFNSLVDNLQLCAVLWTLNLCLSSKSLFSFSACLSPPRNLTKDGNVMLSHWEFRFLKVSHLLYWSPRTSLHWGQWVNFGRHFLKVTRGYYYC